MKAILKELNNTPWICCANCRHKLAKAILLDNNSFLINFTIEFKCTSCRSINYFDNECKIQNNYEE